MNNVRTERAELRRIDRDRMVLNQMQTKKSDAIAIADLARSGWRIGTIRASLKRLMAEGAVERIWDGNQRFGRYLYYYAR